MIAGAGTAEAYWTGYLLITDDSGDPIEGPDFTPTGIQNAIYVTEFHHLVLTDEGTTAPYHKPFVCTKLMDKTSSRLFQAFAQDEHLTIVFKVYDGTQLLFEFEFSHARIVAMEPLSETAASTGGQEYEKIRFIYSTITVRDIAASTEVAWALAGWPS
jgi:type VI secretion system Hcp family effector